MERVPTFPGLENRSVEVLQGMKWGLPLPQQDAEAGSQGDALLN